MKLFGGEAAAEGFVVVAECEPGYQDGGEDYGEGYGPRVGKGERFGPEPRVEEIHQGIVNDVERIGEAAEEVGCSMPGAGVGATGCTYI